MYEEPISHMLPKIKCVLFHGQRKGIRSQGQLPAGLSAPHGGGDKASQQEAKGPESAWSSGESFLPGCISALTSYGKTGVVSHSLQIVAQKFWSGTQVMGPASCAF